MEYYSPKLAMNAQKDVCSATRHQKLAWFVTLLAVSDHFEETVNKSKRKIAPFSILTVNVYSAKKSTLWTLTPESASKSQKQAEWRIALSIQETASAKSAKRTFIWLSKTDALPWRLQSKTAESTETRLSAKSARMGSKFPLTTKSAWKSALRRTAPLTRKWDVKNVSPDISQIPTTTSTRFSLTRA